MANFECSIFEGGVPMSISSIIPIFGTIRTTHPKIVNKYKTAQKPQWTTLTVNVSPVSILIWVLPEICHFTDSYLRCCRGGGGLEGPCSFSRSEIYLLLHFWPTFLGRRTVLVGQIFDRKLIFFRFCPKISKYFQNVSKSRKNRKTFSENE